MSNIWPKKVLQKYKILHKMLNNHLKLKKKLHKLFHNKPKPQLKPPLTNLKHKNQQ